MMVSKLTDIISRVQKILRLAESSNHPGEVAAAQSLAQELITQYQIEEAQLNNHVGSGGITSSRIEVNKPYLIDKSVLLNSIAKHNFCKVLRGDGYCMIYGYQSDIDFCLTLYEILCPHMVSEMKIKLEKAKAIYNDTLPVKAWTKSFFAGYAVTISERIKESKAKVIKDNEIIGTSVELVVRDKQHAIEDYFQSVGKKKSRQSDKLTSINGYDAGILSGKNANLNQTVIEG